MVSIHNLPALFILALALASSAWEVTSPRCRCYPKELFGIAEFIGPCFEDHEILEHEQLNREAFRSVSDSRVSYNLTFVGDDTLHLYIDGVLVACDSVTPKRRNRVSLRDVPCKDIVVRVQNNSPRCHAISGGGVGIIIDYAGQTYGSVPEDVEHPCQYDDQDDYCFTKAAKEIIPIRGKTALSPNENCFPYVPYKGSECSDCKITPLDQIETCHMSYDPALIDTKSVVLPDCDPKQWNMPLIASDTLARTPMCEIIKMGRNGGFTGSPWDGKHKDLLVFGVRFELPFCRNG